MQELRELTVNGPAITGASRWIEVPELQSEN